VVGVVEEVEVAGVVEQVEFFRLMVGVVLEEAPLGGKMIVELK
jgi:hypothetical protein